MNYDQILEKVALIVAPHCLATATPGLPTVDTTPEVLLVNRDTSLIDYGFDSLDEVEIVMSLEDEFGIEVLDEDVQALRPVTINKIAALINQKLGGPPLAPAVQEGFDILDREAAHAEQTGDAPTTLDPSKAHDAEHLQAQVFDQAGHLAAELADICHHANVKWWIDTETGEDVRTWPAKFFKLWVGTKIALCHSELSEALEGYRKDKMDEHLPHRKGFEVEMADTLIRIGDLMGGLAKHYDLDIGGAVRDKLIYNAQRADHKHENRVVAGGKAF